jgi:hypothetical protein
MFDLDATAAATAMLADPAVQQLLAGLSSLTTAHIFLAYTVAAIIILIGGLYTYRIYCDLPRRGEYLDSYFIVPLVTWAWSLKEFGSNCAHIKVPSCYQCRISSSLSRFIPTWG